MQIVSLNITKLHGFLNIPIVFLRDLTVIVGVNGSGKTSALSLMAAMLRLDLSALKKVSFELATLSVIDGDNEPLSIEASQQDGAMRLTLTSKGQIHDLTGYGLVSERMIVDHDITASGNAVFRNFYLHTLEGKRLPYIGIEPPALEAAKRFLAQSRLTFVQLDRTILAVDPEGETSFERLTTAGRKNRATPEPIDEVIKVTKQRFLGYKSETELIKDRAYRQSLRLHFGPISEAMPGRKKVDRASLLQKINDMKARVAKSSLTSDETELKSAATSFFKELEQLLDSSTKRTAAKRTGRRTLDEEQLDAILSLKHWQIEKLLIIFEEEAKATQDAYAAIRIYLLVAERFFKESGKRLTFDNNYELSFTLPGEDESIGPDLKEKPRSLKELSSGERQILVILTYLAFVSGKHSVFVIDEPELSLHLVWQRLLVEAVKQLRPQGCQVILATHAPEIAGRAREHTVRLGNRALR